MVYQRVFKALEAALDFAADPPASASPSEEEVIGLFDQLHRPLLRYVLSIGLAPADAEEVIQEVFLALFQHLRAGKPRDNLRGWLFRVAHNLALKHRQRAAGDRSRDAAGAVADPVDPEPNPEQALLEGQQRQSLLAVVQALPEKERCCLHLRAEGLRYREIAEVLGISLGAVSIALTRALAKLARVQGEGAAR